MDTIEPFLRRVETGGEDPLAEIAQRLARSGSGHLRDRVYAALRWGILAGLLTPGRRLTELELAAALEVSRTPLREAFRRLESERLVSVANGRGVVVRGMTVRDLAQIYQVRLPLEMLAARLSAVQATPDHRLELQRSVDLQYFLAERERNEEFARENDRFHDVIAESSGNQWLAVKLRELRDLVLNLRDFAISDREIVPNRCIEHAQLYEALARRDAERAAALAGEHLRYTCRRVLGDDLETLLSSVGAPEVDQIEMTRKPRVPQPSI